MAAEPEGMGRGVSMRPAALGAFSGFPRGTERLRLKATGMVNIGGGEPFLGLWGLE